MNALNLHQLIFQDVLPLVSETNAQKNVNDVTQTI